MTNDFSADVLICGAGAAGLTLAIDLARRGISFRLIEKLDEPFRGSRGKGIQPRTQEVFEDLGILDRIAAAGGHYPKERTYQDGGRFTETDVMEAGPATPAEPYSLPLMVPQFLTERVMRERLAVLGHSPAFGCELLSFTQDDDGVTARVATKTDTETIRVRWLVGADGGRSFVRHALGIGFPGKTLGVRAIVADVILSGLSRDAWHHFGEGDMQRRIAACPLAGTDLFQLQGPIALDGDVDLSAAGLTALLRERTGRDDLRVRSVSWASAYHMNARLADRYRVGRVFLVGDAAHIHPPTGGQGLNTSVQDAYNLGWKLGAVMRGAGDALLDTYEAERRPIAQAMLGLTTGLLDASRRGEMRRGRGTHQLDIGYPESPLAVESPGRQGVLLAGDRAPDAQVRGAAGQPHRLFDLFKGPHWTLLSYGGEPIAARPGLQVHTIGVHGDLTDGAGQFPATYGATPGDRVLVRPDGYVGAIISAGDDSALNDYLTKVGLRAA
ncbi:2-polyprenyl-6-methoxyphenol hydroxylase [Methylobacterium sp. Leaf104]|uniref:FAD-dependent oxidoreductase n=1 Tax=Methylobacterium TaxID=407 RepID=UPI0007015F0A|nr:MULTISPECIES: FAD-dependent oxidoreductase [Methylobacterium]KQP40878.1 2-polyprenyl-6-methoxyphenol hydroxylase [Methylobacterium sp. Leaf104]MCI9880923.1 FAD-dependent oxidoreductase [Methylobacterium goesingense]